jgi:hypothetical protein
MRVKIISDLPQYDLLNPEVMANFNAKLSGSFGWSSNPAEKIVDIQASENLINSLLEEYKDVILVLETEK